MEEEDLLDIQNEEDRVSTKKVPLLYSWGRNDDGELAITQVKTVFLPTPCRGFRGIGKQIASARTHTAALNSDGAIYMAGSLLSGKIGINAQVNNFRQFHEQDFMSLKQKPVVKKVACGDHHTLAMTDNGILLSWGGSLWNKTGHKSEGIHRIERLNGQKIVDIACGDFHSIALNSQGQVYSWGDGGEHKNKGQLGHSNMKGLPHPELIQFFKNKKVLKIACGDYHTMVITGDDELYAFGEGNYGQLGTGSKVDTSTPKKVILNFAVGIEDYFSSGLNEKTRIEQMALGAKHSLLLTNKGAIYACGYGSQGQLGLGKTQNRYQPTLVKCLMGKKVVMVAAGSNHSLCLTSKHDVFSCGYNAKGQLGIGDEKSAITWTHVSQLAKKNVGKIFAGGYHSWAVIDETEPYVYDYEPPSPLKISIDEMTINKNDNYSKKQSNDNSVDGILNELNSANRKLELIITDVELSHRFIHFVVKDNIRNYKKKIDEYVKLVQDVEKDNMKFYKVSQDGDIYDAHGQLSVPGNPKGSTIMFVCQLPPEANEQQHYQSQKNKISIGDIVMMDSKMLMVDGKVPPHNYWFFKFSDLFADVLEKVRFVELRPKNCRN